MTKFNKTLIAAAMALAGAGAQAAPNWGDAGYNNFSYSNFENLYRTEAQCALVGGCLPTNFNGTGFTAGLDPAGYQRVDASAANNVHVGDIFAGILNVTQILDQTLSATWVPDVVGPVLDQFTGYFVQEVQSITAPASHVAAASADHLTLKVASVDPWAKVTPAELLSGVMFKMYVDTTTLFTASGALSTSIAKATDGVLWGTLGLTDGGFAYTHTDESTAAQASDIANFFAVNLIDMGPGYNAGDLAKVNSTSENEIGGVASGFVCSAADLVNPAVICSDFAGKSNVQINESNTIYGSNTIKNSDWIFESHDPVELQRVPEPGTIALMGLGLLGLAGLRRRAA